LFAVPDDVAKKYRLDEWDVKSIEVWALKLNECVDKLKKERDSQLQDLYNDSDINNVRVPVNNASSFSHFADNDRQSNLSHTGRGGMFSHRH
jgi:hypothetical protein